MEVSRRQHPFNQKVTIAFGVGLPQIATSPAPAAMNTTTTITADVQTIDFIHQAILLKPEPDYESLIAIFCVGPHTKEILHLAACYDARHTYDLKTLMGQFVGRHQPKLAAFLVGLISSPDVIDAVGVWNAIRGPGKRLHYLLDILMVKNQQEVNQISASFSDIYGKNMEKLVREEFFGVARDMIDVLISPLQAHDLHPSEMDTEVLYKACRNQHRVDVLEMVHILRRRSAHQLRTVFQIYETKYRQQWVDAVSHAFSGDQRKILLSLGHVAKDPWDFVAVAFEDCLDGYTVNEDRLMRLLVRHRDNMAQVKGAYAARYRRSLYARVEERTSAANSLLGTGLRRTLYELALLAVVANIITQKLLNLPQYITAHNVSVYVSMPTEASTAGIIQDLFQKGKNCYVPQWTSDEMEMVRVNSWEDYQNLPLNKWNIPEPPHDSHRDKVAATDLDLIVMPGLAFDRKGYRMGHGKGYYDRYLGKSVSADSSKKPLSVALALSAQYVDAVPHDEFDLKPDVILNPFV
ncbi:hypothetical protein SmJEL517_g00825 [Synchytrium microbalum]|uniref:5-formyltetrahydrofolate cyclo-ligase n=1 Tax=Synchytrium microbalum TaxID=1806994 RepID=A0A507CCX7_9FUNG|nr:uncharacterized protein SmJEL517_g00825 [Synchytrium microbalum]TPX37029.1 hypothetical protein SmJEL517_g00825 [Synchytrium microbalum]